MELIEAINYRLLTRSMIAEQTGIQLSEISRILNGRLKPSETQEQKLRLWLSEQYLQDVKHYEMFNEMD